LIILVDLIFYKTKQRGITYLLCKRARHCKKFDSRKASAKIRGQQLTSTNGRTRPGSKEVDPLISQRNQVTRIADRSKISKNGHEYAV